MESENIMVSIKTKCALKSVPETEAKQKEIR